MNCARGALDLPPGAYYRGYGAAEPGREWGMSFRIFGAPFCVEGGNVGRGRRDTDRCAQCRLRSDLCICALIQPIATRTRVVVVMHRIERYKSTNTARLLAAALKNASLTEWGVWGEECVLPPLAQAAVLFPDPSAETLTAKWVARQREPVTLVVPDGNWRQATKVVRKTEQLRGLPKLALPEGPPTRFILRRNTRPGATCTIEAAARALAILEGPERGLDVQRHLEQLFDELQRRVLWSRRTSAPWPASHSD